MGWVEAEGVELAWEITEVMIWGGGMNLEPSASTQQRWAMLGAGWVCWPVEKQSGSLDNNQNQGSKQSEPNQLLVLEIAPTAMLTLVPVLVGGWHQMQGQAVAVALRRLWLKCRVYIPLLGKVDMVGLYIMVGIQNFLKPQKAPCKNICSNF